MNTEAIHGHGPLDNGKQTWVLSAVVGGLTQMTVGFFTMTAIGLVGIPLLASVALAATWMAAAATFVLTVRRNPVLALFVPVANGLLLWGVITAGEAWLGWSG